LNKYSAALSQLSSHKDSVRGISFRKWWTAGYGKSRFRISLRKPFHKRGISIFFHPPPHRW